MTRPHAGSDHDSVGSGRAGSSPSTFAGADRGIAMSPGDRPSSRIVACDNCGKRNRVPDAATGVPTCASCHRPLPWEVDATDGSFAAAIDTKLAVLVDLWAPWCGPCRAVSPAVEDIGRRLAGRLKTVKVNVDEAPGGRTPPRRAGDPHTGRVARRPRGRPPGRRPPRGATRTLGRRPHRHPRRHPPDGSSAMTEPAKGARVPVALVGDGVAVPCITADDAAVCQPRRRRLHRRPARGRGPGERLPPVVLERAPRRRIQVSAVDRRVRSGPGRRPGLRRPADRQRRRGHHLSQHHRGHQPPGLPAPARP